MNDHRQADDRKHAIEIRLQDEAIARHGTVCSCGRTMSNGSCWPCQFDAMPLAMKLRLEANGLAPWSAREVAHG